MIHERGVEIHSGQAVPQLEELHPGGVEAAAGRHRDAAHPPVGEQVDAPPGVGLDAADLRLRDSGPGLVGERLTCFPGAPLPVERQAGRASQGADPEPAPLGAGHRVHRGDRGVGEAGDGDLLPRSVLEPGQPVLGAGPEDRAAVRRRRARQPVRRVTRQAGAPGAEHRPGPALVARQAPVRAGPEGRPPGTRHGEQGRHPVVRQRRAAGGEAGPGPAGEAVEAVRGPDPEDRGTVLVRSHQGAEHQVGFADCRRDVAFPAARRPSDHAADRADPIGVQAVRERHLAGADDEVVRQPEA